MIGIIDYGMGNLFSVSKALERLNVPYFVSDDKEQLIKADGLILPGVGSFKDGMIALNETDLANMIQQYVQHGRPLLGICLGMQLLFEDSEENGPTQGLGLLSGKVKRFPEAANFKVPHMGWNKLNFLQTSPILKETDEDFVYFVHSYYVVTDEARIILANSHYGVEVPAVVGKENLFGMQFHPEKSGKTGIQLLRNFTELVEEGMKIS